MRVFDEVAGVDVGVGVVVGVVAVAVGVAVGVAGVVPVVVAVAVAVAGVVVVEVGVAVAVGVAVVVVVAVAAGVVVADVVAVGVGVMKKPVLSEAFVLIVDLSLALGARSIKDLPGCWEHRLGDWYLAVNGHRTMTPTTTGVGVPPFNAYVERDGWPIAFLTAGYGGVVLGGGETEDALIAELRAALAELEKIHETEKEEP